MNKDSSREHMGRARETVSWIIFIILISLSANSFFKSGGESVNAWALLLLIPLPLSLIISERIKEQNIVEGSLEDWDAMLDINVKGLLYVSKAILPGMLHRESGHIINVGSTAGKEVYPNGNVYCASKHAVDALNQAMRIDLNGKGIRVGAINPGMVETEFSKVRFKDDVERAEKVYQGFQPLKPEDVADIITFMVTRPYHVNIADLTVMCTAQASSTIVNKA